MAGKKYGLDMGTSHIRICQQGQGIVINEKNMIAIQRKKDVIAAGADAYEMYERTPESIVITKPVQAGVIADLNKMSKTVEVLLKKCGCTTGFMRQNSFFLAVPSDATEVEKRAYFDLIAHSIYNTHSVYVIEKPMAAAVGMNLPVNRAKGMMLVDMGAGTTEITVISQGGIVVSKLLKLGGQNLNEDLQQIIREKYHLSIGEKTAEYLKLELGCALPASDSETVRKVYGTDLLTGLPGHAEIEQKLVYKVLKAYYVKVIRNIRKILDTIPPELALDIKEQGVYFTGGVTQISDLDRLFAALLGMRVIFSPKPAESTVKGLELIMERPADYKNIIFSLRDAVFE